MTNGAKETHVCIKAQTRGQTDGQVGEQTHEERCEGGNRSGGGDKVTLNLVDAGEVGGVRHATVARRALARSSRILDDGRVDGDLKEARL